MKASLHKDTGEKMHVYEIGYMLVPTITEEKLPEQVIAIRSIIEESQGVVISENFPSLIPLAYSMEKDTDSGKVVCKEGYFGWIKFEMPMASVSGVDKKISALESVLRSLTVKTFRENVLFPDKVGLNKGKPEEKVSDESQDESEDIEDDDSKRDIDESIDALVIN